MTSATIQVSGVRCERCIGRLAGALRGHDGIEYANANLMGEVSLEWDEDKTSRDEIVAALTRSGFPELQSPSSSSDDRERDSARL
jgi:copper chaperone CopZ